MVCRRNPNVGDKQTSIGKKAAGVYVAAAAATEIVKEAAHAVSDAVHQKLDASGRGPAPQRARATYETGRVGSQQDSRIGNLHHDEPERKRPDRALPRYCVVLGCKYRVGYTFIPAICFPMFLLCAVTDDPRQLNVQGLIFSQPPRQPRRSTPSAPREACLLDPHPSIR